MMAPLIPLALIYGKAKNKVRDPKLTLRVGSRAKRIGAVRLAGVLLFCGFGLLFIALALTGNAETAPGFQKTIGLWMREVGAYLDDIPNFVFLPMLAALIVAFGYAVLRKGGFRHEPETSQSSPPRGGGSGAEASS